MPKEVGHVNIIKLRVSWTRKSYRNNYCEVAVFKVHCCDKFHHIRMWNILMKA